MNKEIVGKLRQILGAPIVIDDETELLVYECDGLTLFKHKPDAVVFPRNAEQVAQIVRIANEYKIPFLPRGAGTGLSGGALAVEGGIVLELQRMNQILSVDVENRFAVVQPGVVNLDLSNAAAPSGYYFAPDPSSAEACSIGTISIRESFDLAPGDSCEATRTRLFDVRDRFAPNSKSSSVSHSPSSRSIARSIACFNSRTFPSHE